MKQVEAILNGDTQEEKQNPECWIHYAESGESIPEYIEQHEQNRLEADLINLEYDTKYRAEPEYLKE